MVSRRTFCLVHNSCLPLSDTLQLNDCDRVQCCPEFVHPKTCAVGGKRRDDLKQKKLTIVTSARRDVLSIWKRQPPDGTPCSKRATIERNKWSSSCYKRERTSFHVLYQKPYKIVSHKFEKSKDFKKEEEKSGIDLRMYLNCLF